MGHSNARGALAGVRIALVYSFEAPNDPHGKWYDRWRMRVIASYGEAVERLGAYPYICDVDTFCSQAFERRLPNIDIVITLNAGVRPVSHFGLVPAVCEWCQLPVLPSTADVILAGERKDIANALARDVGLFVPRTFGLDGLADEDPARRVIVKPRDLGGSYGVRATTAGDLCKAQWPAGEIVQDFVYGNDLTVPVFYDVTANRLRADTGVIYYPQTDDPHQWIYDREDKEAYVSGRAAAKVERRALRLSLGLQKQIISFCAALGVTTYARCDFRIEPKAILSDGEVSSDGAFFIEINPLPTVCTGLAFVEGCRATLNQCTSLRERFRASGFLLDDDYDVIAFVLQSCIMRYIQAK